MRTFTKPAVVVSKCLEFAACRYNGQMIASHIVRVLKPHVKFIPVCPEVEIGLGIPRSPVRLIESDGERLLMQPDTGNDVTDMMISFSNEFLYTVQEVDGFILKSRSPSCGINEVKAYSGAGKVAAKSIGAGFFGNAVLDRFPGYAIEDDGRLKNMIIREHFLTKLFTLADFHRVKQARSLHDLVKFHTNNKFMLLAHNQEELRTLGNIVANHEKRAIDDVLISYEAHLKDALHKFAKRSANINVLLHAFGYFSKQLSPEEKAFLIDNLADYRDGRVPLSAVLAVVREWIVRFNNDYLKEQTYFSPYPSELVDIDDTDTGRDAA